MPSSPPSATLPRLGPDDKKLRSSCDACGTAKVKCDRGQPVCNRCEDLGLSCVYGPSRKIGKPRRKRPAAGVELQAPAEKRICTTRLLQSRNSNGSTTALQETLSISNTQPAEISNFEVGILPSSYSVEAGFGVDEHEAFQSDIYPSLYLDLWPQLGNLEGPLDIPSTPSTEQNRSLKAVSKSHSCPRESYEIFRDLICPSPTIHAPDSNSITVPAQLDTVLHANRNATDRLTLLLKCPCAKSGHRAMVHASIVSRILIWYQQAAGWTGCGSETSQPELVQATGFSIEEVPLSMGTFGVEDNTVQVAFRNQLVLSELKKTASLIDMFTSPDLDGSSASGVADLYSYLGAWLRSEHSRTVKVLTSRLNVLHEDLVS
ncbi:hypothetical protein G7046_g3740 [Stylonectria norvegica]|nr:hypothetical protein G7046_g3740 [Stylonectria norvegica]